MKMIQVRNVPDDLHRSLKERAAREGTTMSDLILSELPRLAHPPSPGQLLERIGRRARGGGAGAARRWPPPPPRRLSALGLAWLVGGGGVGGGARAPFFLPGGPPA